MPKSIREFQIDVMRALGLQDPEQIEALQLTIQGEEWPILQTVRRLDPSALTALQATEFQLLPRPDAAASAPATPTQGWAPLMRRRRPEAVEVAPPAEDPPPPSSLTVDQLIAAWRTNPMERQIVLELAHRQDLNMVSQVQALSMPTKLTEAIRDQIETGLLPLYRATRPPASKSPAGPSSSSYAGAEEISDDDQA